MSTKTETPPVPPELLDRPRLAADVSVHEPAEAGAPWLIQQGQTRYFRVQSDLARLALALNGTRDHTLLAEILGPPWTVGAVAEAVEKLAAGKLLDNGEAVRKSDRRFKLVPPMTLQFTLVRPERMLLRISPLVRALTGRAGVAAAVVLALTGLLVLAGQSARLGDALGQPLGLGTYLAVFLGILATTAVHEFGHGAVLTHHGGRPGRMGVMLFYLSPAFFCDVTDGWRLPRRSQRVAVALAGIVTQVVIAGGAAVASLFFSGAARDGLLVFAFVTYIAGLLNLMPFVKLDGYIALMSHLDVPHLRDRALTDARRRVARVLFGSRHERELPELGRWTVPFGLASMAFPLYMIATAVGLWGDTLQRIGVVGATLMLCGVGYLGYHLVRGFVRVAREARAGGAGAIRIGAVAVLLTAALTTVLALVEVPYTVSAGYTVRDGGRAELLLPPSADRSVIKEGVTVRLYQVGVATKSETGHGVIADDRATATTAPLSAFLPVRADMLPTPADGYPLRLAKTPEDDLGGAVVDAGRMPAGQWIFTKYVLPAFRW
ncbi:daptide biosynthesis intramembrane metalloprotease [Streptomyces sp. QL37]|uniref:daptide biosynthesis intramembrane metalloprotease n=1 Tax=Streptomyces sp. QL37 TaxID=2093747 RepID=UPI000CF2C78C|nr:daptide biosynthesis intramembrane metalloprotease [Streptomyces sp. QL37]PPQ57804.1 hypothetical protein C5F59_14770 [Streptomyces sp. QL37]